MKREFPRKGEKVATAAASCMSEEVGHALATNLAGLSAVDSVNLLRIEDVISIWVGVSEDSRAIRNAVYDLEDMLSERFDGLTFDVHVFSTAAGYRVERFVSESTSVYRRNAA